MTVYVIRDGQLVDKSDVNYSRNYSRADFPTPMLSHMEPYQSPVTDAEISSWRQRDADMRAVDAYDPRDLPRDHVYSKGRAAQKKDLKNGRE
jgi:hypothetical protein